MPSLYSLKREQKHRVKYPVTIFFIITLNNIRKFKNRIIKIPMVNRGNPSGIERGNLLKNT
jgi:hypothetical protein